MGDSSDNVPGLPDLAPGFGRKTALKLMKKHGSLESLLVAAKTRTVGRPYIQDALTQHADVLYRNLQVLKLRRYLDFTSFLGWFYQGLDWWEHQGRPKSVWSFQIQLAEQSLYVLFSSKTINLTMNCCIYVGRDVGITLKEEWCRRRDRSRELQAFHMLEKNLMRKSWRVELKTWFFAYVYIWMTICAVFVPKLLKQYSKMDSVWSNLVETRDHVAETVSLA